MILLVDVGNTRVKWAIGDAKGIGGASSVVHRRDPVNIIAKAWSQLQVPSAVMVSSVAGKVLNRHIGDWCRDAWRLTPEFVVPQRSAWGITNGYSDPESLGPDRWLALIAVHNIGEGPACVIDCGTAVTIDGLDQHGLHLGGLILPGLGLMRESLHRGAAHLPHATHSEVGEFELLATDTVSGIRSGTGLGLAAAIDGLVASMEDRLSVAMRRFLTGGDGGVLAPHVSAAYQLRPHLVLEGLAVVAGLVP